MSPDEISLRDYIDSRLLAFEQRADERAAAIRQMIEDSRVDNERRTVAIEALTQRLTALEQQVSALQAKAALMGGIAAIAGGAVGTILTVLITRLL